MKADSALFDVLVDRNRDSWDRYVQHPFVRQLGDGSLNARCFRHYLEQDYVFLIHFARAFGLAAFKSRTIDELNHAKSSMAAIVDIELSLHIEYCESWGISADTLAATEESTANMAYTRYVMERGLAGDLLDLNVALAPCIVGYATVANWLTAQPFLKTVGNPYSPWIDMYSSDEYQDVATQHQKLLNAHITSELSERRLDELAGTFGAATRLEIGFWQMGLECS